MIYEANKTKLKEDKDLLTIGTGLHIPTLDIPVEASSEKASFNNGKGKAMGAVANRHAVKPVEEKKSQVSKSEIINSLALEAKIALATGTDQSQPLFEIDLTFGLEVKENSTELNKLTFALSKKKLAEVSYEMQRQMEDTQYSLKLSSSDGVLSVTNYRWFKNEEVDIQFFTEEYLPRSPVAKIGGSITVPTKIEFDGFTIEFYAKFNVKGMIPTNMLPKATNKLLALNPMYAALALTVIKVQFHHFLLE